MRYLLKQPPDMFCEERCSKNFENFTEKRLLSLHIYYKETPTQVLSCESYEIFKNTYSEVHLRTTSSAVFLKSKQ